MRNVYLFIAMSLDGYIADSKGSVDWLSGQGCEDAQTDAYAEFVKDIDTILMGWNTYHQIVTKLSPDRWVYEDLTTYVFTHREQQSSDAIHFTAAQPAALIRDLLHTEGKNIWVCGGADLVQQLIKSDLIDRYHITIIPTILGGGIRLFSKAEKEIQLKLLKARTYNGMTELLYEKRHKTTI